MTSLGIMTHRISSTSRFSHYAEEAERLGFQSTIVFTPHGIDLGARKIHGYRYRNGVWARKGCEFPTVVHDMGYYSSPRTIRKVRAFKTGSEVPFTGYALGHKWMIHTQLLETKYACYVPETELMRTPGEALAMARRHGTVMVKPRNGKQGRGIVKLTLVNRAANRYVWKEGNAPAAELSARQTASMLRRRFPSGGALVQRWMDIRDPAGGVFDIRALVQKDGEERWRLTSMAVRQSGLGSIASNVAGGGAVREVTSFLTGMYGEAAAERITEECRDIAAGLPEALEARYGKPFIELGIDLAVERGGGVRIIEVNIKPGKKIVRALSGEKAYADALLLPIHYAKRISDRRDFPSKGL